MSAARFLGVAALLVGLATAAAAAPNAQYAQDFDHFWRAIDTGYAYFDRNRAAWRRARDVWRPRAVRAASRTDFITALEGALGELRDDHASLSERTPDSPRRVPAETDVWAAWQGGAAVVEAVRTYGEADVAGLRPGHVVTRISGVAVERAVRDLLRGAAAASPAARDWALRHALAGPTAGALRLEVREPRGARRIDIERHAPAPANGPPLIGRRMGEERDLGYIRIKGSLADARLPAQFDGALNYLKDTRALILDLREVGGPASQGVVDAILGRFTGTNATWRLREAPGGPRVADTVAPRDWRYRAPVVVLVDRWTAGDGEGLAAGIHALANARLVGTPMAGQRGELLEVRLPHTGIVARFPGERAFHADGTPRELVRPSLAVDLAAPQGGPGDPILYQALKLLERK